MVKFEIFQPYSRVLSFMNFTDGESKSKQLNNCTCCKINTVLADRLSVKTHEQASLDATLSKCMPPLLYIHTFVHT